MNESVQPKTLVMPKATCTLWEQGHFVDLTIIVEGCKFPVHKVVMAGMSDYFCTLLAKSENDSLEVEGLSTATMEKLVELIYCKDTSITSDNVSEILRGAVKLQIQAAIDICTQFMIKNLDVENWYQTRKLFEKYNLTDGNSAVNSFIENKSCEIMNSRSFSQLSLSDMEGLNWDFSSEWDIFLLTNKWVDANEAQRGEYRGGLLSKVRYCLLSPVRLTSIMEMELFHRSNGKKWTKFVRNAAKYQNLPIHQQVLEVCLQSTPRRPPTSLLFTNEPDKQGFYFDNAKGYCFIGHQDLRFPEGTGRVCGEIILNEFLILCVNAEGNQSDEPEQQWFIFNPRTVKWGTMARALRYYDRGCVIHDGTSLYIIGGVTSVQYDTCSHSIDTYSFHTNTWTHLADLPSARMDLGACIYNGKLYVCGGVTDDGEPQDTMECLTLSTKKWESKAPMLEHQCDHTLYVMKIKGATVICFLDEAFRLQCYNPVTNKWSKCAYTYDHKLPDREELKEIANDLKNSISFLYTHLEEAIRYDEQIVFDLYFPEDGFSVEVLTMSHISEAKIDIDTEEFYPSMLSLPIPDQQ